MNLCTEKGSTALKQNTRLSTQIAPIRRFFDTNRSYSSIVRYQSLLFDECTTQIAHIRRLFATNSPIRRVFDTNRYIVNTQQKLNLYHMFARGLFYLDSNP